MENDIWRKERLQILTLVVSFGLLAVFYGMINPAWEAPDEPGHLQYVLYLRQQYQLPVQQNPPEIIHAYHPPLYYFLITLATAWVQDVDNPLYVRMSNPEPVTWQGGKDANVSLHYTAEGFPSGGQVLMLQIGRLLSAIFGMGTVAFVYLAVSTIFPDRHVLAILAASLVALNPQFLFLSGSLNNDTLLTCMVSGSFWSVSKILRSPEQMHSWWLLALLLALGILTKLSGLVDAFAIMTGLSIWFWIKKRWQLWIYGIATVVIVMLVVDGWYFVRNWQLYGDPLGWNAFLQSNINPRLTPLHWLDLEHFFTTQFNSFWGLFGWMNVWAPAWFYQWSRILSYFAFSGWCIFLVISWRKLAEHQKIFLLVSGFALILHEAQILWGLQRMNESWYQGRYLFPMFVPIAIAMSCGVLYIFSRRAQPIVAMLLVGVMLAIALYMPLNVIAPIYRWNALSLPAYDLWSIDKRLNINFGDQIRLRGYNVEQQANELVVTLYWQAIRTPDFNYSAFVHLLAQDGSISSQQDHAPGEFRAYPPVVWRPEDIVADVHELSLETPPIDESAKSPVVKQLRIGLYNWQTNTNLPIRNPPTPAQAEFLIVDVSQ